MKRREFIHKGVLVAVGAAVNSRVKRPPSMVSTPESWTAGLRNINVHEGVTLLRMSREIFPHDRLTDSYYITVVNDLDTEAGKNSDTQKLLQAGVADLDRSDKKFVDMSPEHRLEVLKKIQDSPFFQKVRGTEIVSLYNNPGVWKEFGFAGPSYPFGGYLYHGFNDLNWLPDPPESASPKPA
jgi:hypothetical protein